MVDFQRKSSLEAHEKYCGKLNFFKVLHPSAKNNLFMFKNYHQELKLPRIINGDLETFSLRVNTKNQEHVAMAVILYVIKYDGR